MKRSARNHYCRDKLAGARPISAKSLAHMTPEPDLQETDLVITEIRITPKEDGALRAFATITLNNSFVVRGLKVIEGSKGRFVAMPSRQRRDGSYQDIAHPITKPFRSYMETSVLQAFVAEVEDSGDGPEAAELG